MVVVILQQPLAAINDMQIPWQVQLAKWLMTCCQHSLLADMDLLPTWSVC
jgi:hypothetical protein